jgi:hypothetical protein
MQDGTGLLGHAKKNAASHAAAESVLRPKANRRTAYADFGATPRAPDAADAFFAWWSESSITVKKASPASDGSGAGALELDALRRIRRVATLIRS